MLSCRLLLALAAGTLALLATPALAQDVPRQMVFQGRLVRADGSPENSPQDLRFAVYPTPTGGAPLWEESHPGVPVTNGYYSVVLGAAAPLPPEVFNGQALHLGVSLVGQSELTPRLPVVSVPYALRAGDSERLGGLSAASFSRSEHSHPVATASSAGFMSAADKAKLDAGGQSSITAGAGLTLSGSTLSANFTASGGTNGTATTVARGDHRHALSCLYRRASASGGGQTTTAVAYCAAGEVLSGGSCAEAETSGSNRMVSGGEPTVATTASAQQSEGGPGFRCVTSASTLLHSTAFCCRVTP